MIRDWIIVLDKSDGQIKVLNSQDYLKKDGNYLAIDDSSSEYKAQLKVKEIKCMGISKYLEARSDKLTK